MADGRHVGKYWKYWRKKLAYQMDRLGQNLGGRIPSRPQHVRHDAVAMVTAVA